MKHSKPASSIALLRLLVLAVLAPIGFAAFADVRELEREYYELDYKMRQWVKLQEANKQIIVPPGFQEDLARYNQVAAQLGVARAEQAAELAAEDEGEKGLVGMLATRDTVDKVVELVDAKIADLNKESEFYEEWYKKWLEEAKTDTGVAITANDSASPAQRDWNKLQQMKDEAVRRQREIENKIADLEKKRNAMQYGMTSVKTLLGASDIKDAIGEGDFFEAADKTIDLGSGIGEVVYDEKTFKKMSERLEVGKSGLGAAKKLWEGEYLDGAIDVANTVDSLIEDVSKDLAKESGTLKLFMESDFTDPALKKQALQVIDIANTRKINLEKVVAMKNRVKGVGSALSKFQRMKGWYDFAMAEIQGYKQLAAEPGRSGTTTRLIAGMSKLGTIFKEGAAYLPPGLQETVGQFLEFYGEALQLGDEIDKKIRDYFEKRGACLNVVGGLQNTYCVEQIEKKYNRWELCLNYAPEFRDARLPMFVDIGLEKAVPQPQYFYIPDTSRDPVALTDAQYKSLIKIASDYGAYCTILQEDYQLTAEDLGSIVDAVVNNKPDFTINNGVFYDTTFTIKDLAEDVRVLLHVREAIGEQLTPDNAREMIVAWQAFEADVAFAERLCAFTICDNDRERNRLFVTYLSSRESYNGFIERQKMTKADSRCRATLQIKGADIVVAEEPMTYEAVPNEALNEAKDVKYVWHEYPGAREVGTGRTLSRAFAKPGVYGLRVKASGRAGGALMELAEASLKIEVQEAGAGDYVFDVSGPDKVPVGQPAVLKASMRGLNRRGRDLVAGARIRWLVGESVVGAGEYCSVEGRPAGSYTATACMLTQTNGKYAVTDTREHAFTVSDDAGRAQIVVTISGPTRVKAGGDLRLSATVTAKDALSKQLADRGVVIWSFGDTVVERGNTVWMDAGPPGDYEINARVVVQLGGRDSVVAQATHRWTVSAEGAEGGGAPEPPKDPGGKKPPPPPDDGGDDDGAGLVKPGKHLYNPRCVPPKPTTKGGAMLSVGVKNPPRNAKYYWEIGDKPSKDYLALNETSEPKLPWKFSRTGKHFVTVMLRDLSRGGKYDTESLVDHVVMEVEVSDAYVKISTPSEVYEGDRFTATLEIAPELAREARTYKWALNAMDGSFFKPGKFEMYGTQTVETKTPSVTFQASRRHGSADLRSEFQICCQVRKDDSTFGILAEGMSAVVKVKPPDMTLAHPGWTLTEDAVEQYTLKRNPFRTTVPLSSGGSASITVEASLNVRMWQSDSAQSYSGESLAVGKFKGAVTYREKTYTDAYDASADGGMQHQKSCVSFYGKVSGQQSTKDPEAATVLTREGRKALDEMKAAIRGLKITSHEQVTNATTAELAVELIPEKTSLNHGDVVKVVAKVTGGTEPYSLTWSGNHGKGSDPAEVLFAASTPGEHKLSVFVTDAEGKSASAEVTLTLETYVVEIAIEGGTQVVLGDKRTFRATVKQGKTASAGAFEYQWQPHPEVTFEPYAGPDNSTAAKFTRAGPVRVWVSVLQDRDGKPTTVGESEQIEIEVVAPRLSLSAEPMEPQVGEEVRARVTVEDMDDDSGMDFWWEIAGNASDAGALADNHEYTFRTKDVQPVTVTVHAKARDGGDDLGEAKVTVKAKAYEVKIGEPKLLGPPPRVWDPKKGGLVEVPRAIGTFQDFSVSGQVSPAPADAASLRYAWSVEPEGCAVYSPFSRETRCNAGVAGAFTLSLKVRNAAGVELGAASRSVSIIQTTSDADAKAKQEEAARKEREQRAQQLINEAYGHEQRGELKEAVAKYKAALQLVSNAQVADRVKQLEKTLADEARAQQLINEGHALEQAGKLAGAVSKYEAAYAIVKDPALAAKIAELKKALELERRAQALIDAGAKLEATGNLKGALAKYEEAYGLVADPGLAAKIKSLKSAIGNQDRAQRLINEGYAHEQAGRLEKAIQSYEQAVKIVPNAEIQKHIGELKDMLASKKTVSSVFDTPPTKPPPPKPPATPPTRTAKPPPPAPPAKPPAAPTQTAKPPAPPKAPATTPPTQTAKPPAAPPKPPVAPPQAPKPPPVTKPPVVSAPPKPPPAPVKSLAGSFVATMSEGGESATLRLDLQQNGNRVTGMYSASGGGMSMKEPIQGTIQGNQLVMGGGAFQIGADYNELIMRSEDGTVVFKRVR